MAQERIVWQLVPPSRQGMEKRCEEIEQELSRLESNRAVNRSLTDEEEAFYEKLVDELELGKVDCCEAAGAPLLGGRPDFEEVADRRAAEWDDPEIDRAGLLDSFREDPDCEACGGASPNHPEWSDCQRCEMDLTPLLAVLESEEERQQVLRELSPDEMRMLSDDLEAITKEGRVPAIPGFDAKAYLAAAVIFVRFWADRGFGVAPCFIEQ